MYIYLVLAALFGAGFIANVLDAQTDWAETSTCLILFCMGVCMFFWIRISHTRSKRTLAWLLENKDRITDAEQHFRDGPVFDKAISKKTKLRSFRIVTSAIFVTSVAELGMEFRKGPWAGMFATA